MNVKAGILVDLTKCVGCGACTLACQEINGLPVQATPSKLSDTVWTMVSARGSVNVKRQCMHCLEPACVSVCPVRALQKTEQGPVIYDEDRCIGCRYCMLACPFGIPKYEWDSALPKVQKCTMCYQKRVSQGLEPACASVCPSGALKFGDRDALIQEAAARIDASPGTYVDHIFGVKEAGGTSVLYLSPVPFEELGFNAHVQESSYPKLTWAALSKVPNILGIGGVLMFGVYWVINRRMMMEHAHNELARTASGDEDRREGTPS